MSDPILTNLPLCNLVPGAFLNIDSRRGGAPAEALDSLVRSIDAHGLIAPLVVVKREVDYYVIDGNRRLEALRTLHGASNDVPVPCYVREDQDDAVLMEASLVANVERFDLHPVDEYETFAAMWQTGLTVRLIAARFNVDERDVHRSLALGKLHPEIRAAWRAGQITGDVAKAFTVTDDQALQGSVFSRLWETKSLWPRQIKAELVGDPSHDRRLLTFVGRDVYLADGGKLAVDLFGEDEFVLDRDRLLALSGAKLADLVEQTKAQGWAWVTTDDDPEVQDAFRWLRIRPAPAYTDQEVEDLANNPSWERQREIDALARFRALTPEQIAQSGCILRINYDGEVMTDWGFIRPDGQQPTDAPAKAPEQKDESNDALSAKVLATIRHMQTRGLQAAIAADPGAAKRALLATLIAGDKSGSPLVCTIHGVGPSFQVFPEPDSQPKSFEDALIWAFALRPGAVDAELAKAIAGLVNTSTDARDGYRGQGVRGADIRALTGFLSADTQDHLAKAFDPAIYFREAKKVHALDAIREIEGADSAAQWAKRPKGEIADAAARIAEGKPWLPADIRPAQYKLKTGKGAK